MNDIITSKTPFILVSDDDGHDYLIPKNEEDQFYKWVESVDDEEYLSNHKSYDSYMTEAHRLEIYSYRESE